MSFLDRNSSTPLRDRRNSQRLRSGDATSSVKITAPLTLSAGAVTLGLFSTGGLQVSSSQLSLKLADTSLQLAAGGLSAHLADTSLAVSAGLKVNLADTSLATSSGVKINLAANSGLTVSSGLKLLLADTSLALGVGGVLVNLAATPGLQVATGLSVKLADNSIAVSGSGMSVARSATGAIGLALDGQKVNVDGTSVSIVSDALTVTGVQTLASDPGSPSDGQVWYNTTSQSQKERGGGLTMGTSHMVYSATADGSAVVNTLTQTASVTAVTFPANFFTAGKAIRFRFHGQYSCNTATTTLAIGAYLGAVSLDGNPAFSAANGAAGANFGGESWMVCRTAGAAGTFSLFGDALFDNAAHTFAPSFNSPVINTTVTQTFTVKLTWNTASAGNTATVKDLIVEVLDPP